MATLARNPDTNSSPSNTGEAPPISFWKNDKYIPVFAAQSSTYLAHGSPVIQGGLFGSFDGIVPQPFLSDGEIAAWSLAAIGADSVRPLMEMLTNSNPQIRCRAAMALGMIGKEAEPAVPALIDMLQNLNRASDFSAARTRGVPGFVNTLHDPESNTRREAADALGWIGQQTDLVIPALIKAFDDKDVESSAIESLGALGVSATNAIPALLALLSRTTDQYRIHDVALALSHISPETTKKEVMPFLINIIQSSESPWSKSMTLNTLGQMRNEPALVIPVLLEALDSTTDYNTRSTIVYQLGWFGPAATSAIPRLISFSTGQDTNLCRLATNTLDKIKPGWRTGH